MDHSQLRALACPPGLEVGLKIRHIMLVSCALISMTSCGGNKNTAPTTPPGEAAQRKLGFAADPHCFDRAEVVITIQSESAQCSIVRANNKSASAMPCADAGAYVRKLNLVPDAVVGVDSSREHFPKSMALLNRALVQHGYIGNGQCYLDWAPGNH